MEITSVSQTTEKKEMENIENAVVQAAVFCYGTEGAYPESLAYLRQHYGLRYDEKNTLSNMRSSAKTFVHRSG